MNISKKGTEKFNAEIFSYGTNIKAEKVRNIAGRFNIDLTK
mgnify:CR=1 FL=1